MVDRFASKALGASKSMNGVLSDWLHAHRSGMDSGKIVSFTVHESLSIPNQLRFGNELATVRQGDRRHHQSDCGGCWAFAANAA